MKWENKFTKWVGSRMSVVLHTLFFIAMFSSVFFGINFDTVLLVLTTLVSLEAIYLSIFIQMSVNQNTVSLHEVEEEIEEIAEGVDEISEDIDEIQHDVDEIQEDVDEIQHDVDEIEKGSDNVIEIGKGEQVNLENIQQTLKRLVEEVEKLKR